MRAADPSLLVRLLTGDDIRQTQAAEPFIRKGAWVSILALAETVRVLTTAYGRSAAQIADAVEMLLAHEHLTLQDPDVILPALELFRSRPKLGFSDCLTLQLARKAGHLPLGTFDRVLGKIDGAQKL